MRSGKISKSLITSIKVDLEHDLPLFADFYDTEKIQQPLLIFSHGFKGFKNWGGFPYMLEKLSNSGYKAAALNFSHNGVNNDNPAEFTHPDLFAKNTFSRELTELGIVIGYFYNNAGQYNIDRNKIALIGHSRGGGISILKSYADERIKCLVTLSSVSTFDRYSEKAKELWRKTGYIEAENTRTKQMMRLNLSLLEDIETNNHDIIAAIGKLKIPVLIVHGREDLAVKYSEAEELWKNSDKELSELFPVENTGHTFGVVHPFEGTTPAFEKVIEKVKEFLEKKL